MTGSNTDPTQRRTFAPVRAAPGMDELLMANDVARNQGAVAYLLAFEGVQGPVEKRMIAFTGDIDIGRGAFVREGEELAQEDPRRSISERHCHIAHREGTHYISDLTSTNGTFVHGGRLNGEQGLANGDVVALGDTRLYYNKLR